MEKFAWLLIICVVSQMNPSVNGLKMQLATHTNSKLPGDNINMLPSPTITNILKEQENFPTPGNNYVADIPINIFDELKHHTPGDNGVFMDSVSSLKNKFHLTPQNVQNIAFDSALITENTGCNPEVTTGVNDLPNTYYNILEDSTLAVNGNSLFEAPLEQILLNKMPAYQKSDSDPDLNNYTRSKNSINFNAPETYNFNSVLSQFVNDQNQLNNINNLYSLQYLPNTYIKDQNVDPNTMTDKNVDNNPLVKENIIKYMNSIRLLQSYQEKGQNLIKNNKNNAPVFGGNALKNEHENIESFENRRTLGNDIIFKEVDSKELFKIENNIPDLLKSQYYRNMDFTEIQEADIKNNNKNYVNMNSPFNTNEVSLLNTGIFNSPTIHTENVPISRKEPIELQEPSMKKLPRDVKVPNVVTTSTNFLNTAYNPYTLSAFNSNSFPKVDTLEFINEGYNQAYYVTNLDNIKPSTIPYNTNELTPSLSTPNFYPTPIKTLIDTSKFLNKLPSNPSHFSKSGVGLNLKSSNEAGTQPKFNLDKIPIKPELLASIRPVSLTPFSPNFGVTSLLNTFINEAPTKIKNAVSVDIRTQQQFSEDIFNTPTSKINCDPYRANLIDSFGLNTNGVNPVTYPVNILSNSNENILYQNNPISTIEPFRNEPIINPNIKTIVNLPKPKMNQNNPLIVFPEIVPYPVNNERTVRMLPENLKLDSIPIPNITPPYKPKDPASLPFGSVPPFFDNSQLKSQYVASVNEINYQEISNPVKFSTVSNFPILPSPNSNSLNHSITFPPLKGNRVESSPLLFVPSAPEVPGVPIVSYIDGSNGKYSTQNFFRDRSSDMFCLPYTNMGPVSPISYLPTVNPSAAYIPQPSLSYTSLGSTNTMSSQIEKLLYPSGVVGSINDATAIVTKNEISSLLTPKFPLTKSPINIPSDNSYKASQRYTSPRTVIDPSIFWEPFYNLEQPNTKISEVLNEFEVPDFLSQFNIHDLQNLVWDYPDFSDFETALTSEMTNLTPMMSSLTVNVVPVIEEFGLNIRCPPNIPNFHYPSISPSYLPAPNINLSPQIVCDNPTVASNVKCKDTNALSRLLKLLVMSSLLNKGEFHEMEMLDDIDAAKALLL